MDKDKREPLMTEEHFSEVIKFDTDIIEEIKEVLTNNPAQYKKIQNSYNDLFVSYRQILFSKYSKGDDVAKLSADAEEAIKWYITYQQHPDHDPFYFDVLDEYVDILQLYALGLLLNIKKTLLTELLLTTGNKGEDALFDTLAAFVQKGRTVGSKLLFPAAYQSLWDAMQSNNPAQQAGNMQKFLKGWYKSMRKCYWHDRHLSAGKGGFPGYWCWEAALITVLYNVDDTLYRDMPFYPKDIAGYAKNHHIE